MTHPYTVERNLILWPATLLWAFLHTTLCPIKLVQCLHIRACWPQGRTPIPRARYVSWLLARQNEKPLLQASKHRHPSSCPACLDGTLPSQILRDRDLSASLCEDVSGDLSECQLLCGKCSQSQRKTATQPHWKYNIEALCCNVAIYSCHTTLTKWNHILCQISKDIITWKLFLLPWCMVRSSLPQM